MPRYLTYENYRIVTGGGAKTFSVSDNINEYNLIPDTIGVLLVVDLTIDPTGTPIEGMQYVFNYGGSVIYDGGQITIFGRLLTAIEAQYQYTITCTYTDGDWVVKLEFSDLSTIGTASITDYAVTNAKLAGSITLAKILASTRGFLARAEAFGVWAAFSAVTSGNLVMGNGTDVVSQAMSGDATINGTGVITVGNDKITTAKILNANVTVAKVEASLKANDVSVDASFETGELGAYPYRMSYAGSVTNFFFAVTKAMAATDVGTVIIKNNAGVTMTLTTPVSIPASTAIGTSYNTAVTANNTFVAGDIITVFTAKATAGGKGVGSLGVLRS